MYILMGLKLSTYFWLPLTGSYPGGSGVGGSGSYPGGSGVGGSGSYPGGSGVGGSGSYPGGSGVGGSGSYPGGSGGSGTTFLNLSFRSILHSILQYQMFLIDVSNP
jgi:hypothetical protein